MLDFIEGIVRPRKHAKKDSSPNAPSIFSMPEIDKPDGKQPPKEGASGFVKAVSAVKTAPTVESPPNTPDTAAPRVDLPPTAPLSPHTDEMPLTASSPASESQNKTDVPKASINPPQTTPLPPPTSEMLHAGSLQTQVKAKEQSSVVEPVLIPSVPAKKDSKAPSSVSSSQPASAAAVPSLVVSPTARQSPDRFGLARTSGQRGAELLAAIRAELTKDPVELALAKPLARLLAMVAIETVARNNKAIVNYIPARTQIFKALIKEAIKDIPQPTLVEVAAGFSPRGLQLAVEMPNLRVIEVDLPDVMKEKQERLKNIELPKNIAFLGADLGVTALSELLKEQTVHVISSEGLFPYFPHTDLIRMARDFASCLEPGGTLITDFHWERGAAAAGESANFFSGHAGKYLGAVNHQEEPKGILEQAGFSDISVHLPEDLVEKYGLIKPILSIQLIVVAAKDKGTTS